MNDHEKDEAIRDFFNSVGVYDDPFQNIMNNLKNIENAFFEKDFSPENNLLIQRGIVEIKFKMELDIKPLIQMWWLKEKEKQEKRDVMYKKLRACPFCKDNDLALNSSIESYQDGINYFYRVCRKCLKSAITTVDIDHEKDEIIKKEFYETDIIKGDKYFFTCPYCFIKGDMPHKEIDHNRECNHCKDWFAIICLETDQGNYSYSQGIIKGFGGISEDKDKNDTANIQGYQGQLT